MAKIKRGNVYRSGFEAVIAKELREAGIPFDFEPDKLVYYKRINSGTCLVCGAKDVYQKKTYTPDFKISDRVYIEAKGLFDSADRAKLILVKDQHPEIYIRLVFQRNNLINYKNSTTRYSNWAEAHGFPFSIGGLLSDPTALADLSRGDVPHVTVTES